MAITLVGTWHKKTGTKTKSIFALLYDETYRLYEESKVSQEDEDSVLPDYTTMWTKGMELNENRSEKYRNLVTDWDIDKIDEDLEDIPQAGTAVVREIVKRILERERSRIQTELVED
jgi:hypothetical protein